MITADQIADRLIDFLHRRVMLSSGTRREFRDLVTQEFTAVAPKAQPSFGFDEEGLEGQSLAILELLKERRSVGATNGELSEIALRYGARIMDLREKGFKITCVREGGRTFRYTLEAQSW